MNKQLGIFLVIGASLLAGFFVAKQVYQQQQEQRLTGLAASQLSYFVREASFKLGAPDAKVYLTEFLDPACETCRDFHPVVKDFLQRYEGKIQWVARYAPFHEGADEAVKALEAARKQNLYNQALEALFARQNEWADHHQPNIAAIFPILSEVGIDMERLRQDMNSSEVIDILAQDARDLQIIGVRATPSFFVNGRPLARFSQKDLQDLIESEIEKQYPSKQ